MHDFIYSILPVLGLILGFGFIIFVHELGHFLVAKAVGIKVTQFAIGFGQAILCYRKGLGYRFGTTEKEYEKLLENGANPDDFGETEYRLNWMPLGGYVKMLGQEDLDPQAASDDPRSFNRKPVWARAAVISAGVVMNFIFAILFFVLAFTSGVAFPPAIVGRVVPNSAAANAIATQHPDDPAYVGLQSGDVINTVDDEPVEDFMDMAVKVALAVKGTTLNFQITRDGETAPLIYQLKPKVNQQKLLSIGITSPLSLKISKPKGTLRLPTYLTEAGVTEGMVITSVNSTEIKRFDQLEQQLAASHGKQVKIQATNPTTHQQATFQLTAMPTLTAKAGDKAGHLIGLVPATRITMVKKKSAADKSGLLANDVIVQLGHEHWPTMLQLRDIVQATTNQNSDQQALDLTVLRHGKQITLKPVTPINGLLGVAMMPATNLPIVSQTLPNTPAATLDLLPGSRITQINHQPIHDFSDIQRLLAKQANETKKDTKSIDLKISYEMQLKNNLKETRTVTLATSDLDLLKQAGWTLPADMNVFAMATITIKAAGPADAIKIGISKTKQFMLQTYATLARLFEGSVKVEHLRGPIGIIHEGSRFASKGWTYLMFFLGVISVNLVVVNFLPIPIVDGGLMVFLIIEKIKGSPVSTRIQTAAMVVGMVMIGSVFLITLFYDVSRFFQ